MRPIALYLPQYHSFPENDEWWGKGYTEWTAVRRAKPLYRGHIQPRVPKDGNYYDLIEQGAQTLMQQAKLAREYGVYGFSFYQYWFNGKMLMQRPMEILLEHPEIDINYCICWANETWTRTWYGLEQEVLMKQEYGDEDDWRKHFEYLLGFFRDSRYIKVNNKPLLQIYRSFDIERLSQMRSVFDELARKAGFDGIFLVSGKTAGKMEDRESLIDGYYTFEPGYSLKHELSKGKTFRYNVSVAIKSAINKVFKTTLLERRIPVSWIYDAITNRDYAENEFPGIIARWDNTPRRSYKGLEYYGASAEKFGQALRKLAAKVSDKENDFVFINAWNEWGEGAMLEADEAEGYAYLEAVRDSYGEK